MFKVETVEKKFNRINNTQMCCLNQQLKPERIFLPAVIGVNWKQYIKKKTLNCIQVFRESIQKVK